MRDNESLDLEKWVNVRYNLEVKDSVINWFIGNEERGF